MALDGTYTGLQASVADWLNRSDLTSQIPDFITLAHADLNQRLRVRQMVTRTSITVASELMALPADFLAPISLSLTGYPVLYGIDPAAMADQKFLAANATGRPTSFCLEGGQVEFGPAPGGAYAGLLVYYAAIPTLGLSNPGNWLLSTAPGAYLYGALTQSAPFLKDDARLATWGQLYLEAVQALQAADTRYGAKLSPRAVVAA
jgi:hypothetical protein